MILTPLLTSGANPLSVTMNPTYPTYLASSSSGTTSTITATVTGAVGAVTVLWTTGGYLVPVSPTNLTTDFSFIGLFSAFESIYDSVTVTVTDSFGRQADFTTDFHVFRIS